MTAVTNYPLQIYTKQLLSLFNKAKSNADPALYLYKNKARDVLFKAEAILRMCSKINEDKQTTEWYETIKKLEDYLGAIDNYINLLGDFSKLKNINVLQLEYISDKLEKSVDKLNKKLKKKDFYLKDLEDMHKDFKINLNDKDIISKIETRLWAELKEGADFFYAYPKGFDDMEGQVHELRRKIRWLSIYGSSFNGLIVLKDSKEKHKWEKEFITKNEISNPYNKFPVKKTLPKHIYFNKKAFYALSHVIDQLGTIKDKGLGLYSLEKSIRKTNTEKGVDAHKLALKQLNAKYTEASLLKEAHTLLNAYFNKNKIHSSLM